MKHGTKWAVFGALVTAALAFLLVGVALGQPNAVLQKAIHICLECIGIG